MANSFTSNYLEKRRKRIGTAAFAASRSSEKEEEKEPKKTEEKDESKGSYTSNYLKAREKRTGGTVPSAKEAVESNVREVSNAPETSRNALSQGSATLNNLDNMGSNRVAELKKRLEEARQKEIEASRAQVQAASELRKTKDGNKARELAAAVQAASDEYNAIKRELDMYDYIDEYKGKVYEDDFVGQFSANKTLGRLSQDTSAAYNEYWQNPTDENRAYAEAMDMLTEYFQQQNAEALDDENAKATWITKSAAQYLPQWWDQTKATVAGGAAGALAGAGIGFAAGGIGAIPGAIKGAQVGATAASGLQSYGQMRGAAFRELLAAGVDEETARAAANDEGVISGLIEMGDTALTVFTLGTGKLLTALGKGGVKAVAGEAAESGAKRLLKALGKYGVLNIGQEMLEEGTQQAVSIANQDRDNTGKWDLVKESADTAWDAITGEDKEARSEIWDAAKEGGKIAAMFGGVQRVGDFAVESGIRSHVGKKYTEQMGADTVTAAIEAALDNEEGSDSRKIAEKLQKKQEAGKTVSNADVGALLQAVESEKRAEEVQPPAEATQSAQETLENLARETVAQMEKAQQAQPVQRETVTERATVPFNVMAEDNPVRQQKIAESKNLERNLGYGEQGMKAFNQILETGNESAEQVRSRFQSAYEAGMTNLPRQKAYLVGSTQETAYNAGVLDSIQSMKKAEAKGATVWGKEGGLIRNEYSSKLDATTADTLQMIGKATGTKIIMQAQVYGGKANGSYKDGIVTIASDAANPYIVVAKHEVTHRMQDLAPKQYTAYRDYAVQIMAGSGSKMTLVEQYQDRAAKQNVYLTAEQAMDEIAADFTEKILTDEKALNDFVNHASQSQEQRTMGQKFFQAVREFIDKVKRIFKGDRKKMDQAAQEQYGATIEQLEKAEALWKEAYRAAEDKAKDLENRGVQEYNGNTETQYSRKGYWRPQLTKAEWSLLNSRMDLEIGNPAFDIDNASKWLYANEKGTTVFAVYGIGDGTEPTPLYATGGEKAKADYAAFNTFMEGINHETDTDRAALDRLFEDFESKHRDRRGRVPSGQNRGAENRNVQIPVGERRSDRGGNPGAGTENLENGVKYSLKETDGKVTVYHGSKTDFDTFDFSKLKDELGIFFAETEVGASQWGNAKQYTLAPKKTLVVHQGEEYRKIMMTGETDAEKRKRFVSEGYDTLKIVYGKPGGGETVDWVALTPDVIQYADDKFSLKTDGDITTVTDKDGEVVAETHKDGTTMFSLKTYKDDGRAYLHSWLGKKVKANAITQAEADDITRQLDEFYDICQKFTDKYGVFGAWSNAEVVMGKDGKPAFSVVKANGDYAMNLDFSLVCKKRRTLDAVFREMINRDTMDNVELGEEQIAKINQIIRESGFETACALCFVDSKRYRQAMVADNFVTKYNDLVEMLIPEGSDIKAHRFDFLERGAKNDGRGLHEVPNNELGKGILKLKKVMQEEPSNKTVNYKIASHLLNHPEDRKLVMRSEFMNTDGFEAITVKNRAVLGLYNSSKGSGGPKAALSDVQYLGDILKKSNFTPARAYAVGGVRIQSFSDYIPRLVFDYLQMIADLSAKKLPAHAYTKEEMFALQFGMTGIKVNMSLVPAVDPNGIAPGLDAKGNYTWYDGQSFGSDVNVKGSAQTGFKRAVEIQKAAGYSANCGTIAVGISDKHIWKMLDDDDIRMVIPYHKSSLNHIVAVLNNIDKYTDYTSVQNTRFKATGSKIEGKDFNFNEALQKLGDAKAAANAYLEWCEKHDYLPKFDTFAEHENYYKLLEDFSTYDNGENAPQGPVTMTFPGKDAAFGSMTQLIERGLEEDAILEGRRQADVPKIVDRIEAVYREGGMKQGAQFSLKGQDDLLKQNAKLKEVNQELRDQFKTTKFAKVDKKALRQFAKQLLKDYQSGADIDETRDTLDNVFTYISNGENGESAVWEVAYERAYDAAVSILSNSSTLNDELFQAYKGMREDIKTTGITINKMYDHDLIGYESINEFRRANFGRIKLVNDGIPVDVFYEGLAYSYPEFFDSDTYMTQADQLSHIEEVLNNLQPTEVNPYSRNMREAATWLANDIMERYFELPQAKPTFADKAERKLTKQVIKDAEKLERLREQKNERIAELIEERREKVKEVTRKEKEKRDQKIREVKEHYREKEAKSSESRKAKILRERIIRHTQEMSQTLLRPSDKRHIPESLRAPVAAVLDAINLESQYTIDPATGKRQKNVPGDPTKRTLAFTDLRKAYQNIIQDDGADITVDPAMEAMLDLVIDLRDVKLADMNMSQLKTVWDVVRVVEHTINNAGRLLSETKYERTIEWANAMVKDTETRRSKRGGKAEAFRLDMENPYTFFSHYGDSGKAVFRMLRDAQDKQQLMVENVQSKVQAIVDSKTVRKLEKEVHEITTERGDKLTLTTAQVMDIYLLTKRQQAQEHLMSGGIVQPEVKSKKIKRGTDAILLSYEDLKSIVGKLDAKQKEIADKLQELTRTTLADYGNEASMKAYGYKKFTGNDYWPIKSAREGIHSNVEKGGNNTRSIKNIGLAKSVMPHANNPLDIGGVFQTFASHAADMTDYAAWLCPMEDANRLFNFQFRDDWGNRTGKTIKGMLDRVGGKGAQQYWHNLMEDIQNGIKGQNDTAVMGFINKVYGNTKGASVAWNIRVIVQQPTAIVRAAAFVNPDAIIRGMFAGGGWKAALKHSPIAQRKDMGGFDISSPMQMNEVLFDSKTGLQRFNEVGMAGAAWADRVTWGRIWNFCEQEVRLGRDDLTPRSDEFYEAVNELFTDVVDQSQVVDGVLQRAQIMRSNNALANQATSFMGEPMMAMNMLLRAYDGLVNETNKSKRGKAFKTFGRAAVVLLVTNVVNALAQSLVDAARDDEDDEYWEKFLTAFTGVTGEEKTTKDKVKNAALEGNLIGGINPLGYVPFVKDLLSIMSGYSVQRADAAIMEDILQAGTAFFGSWFGEGNKTKVNTLWNLAKQVGKVWGIGASNLTRDVYAALRTAALETGNIPAQYELEKWIYKNSNEKNDARFVDILYKAYQTDKDVYEHIYNDLAAAGMDAKSIKDKMESHMKKDQGVTKVEDLENRYLHPDEQRTYDSKLKSVSNSSLWRSASTKQKEEVEVQLYNLTVGNDDGVKLKEKISDGKDYGLSETEYLLYELALDMVDQPNKSGKLGGTPTNEEKAAAIAKMSNLGNGEIAFLWDSKEGYEAYAAGLDMRAYVERVGDGQNVDVEKMVGAMDEGMSEDDYYDFLDMLNEVDQPTESGKLGTFTQDEAKAAISAMPGLTREQRAWLWQSVNKGWKDKNNPWK